MYTDGYDAGSFSHTVTITNNLSQPVNKFLLLVSGFDFYFKVVADGFEHRNIELIQSVIVGILTQVVDFIHNLDV